jgi:hypothetical protein
MAAAAAAPGIGEDAAEGRDPKVWRTASGGEGLTGGGGGGGGESSSGASAAAEAEAEAEAAVPPTTGSARAPGCCSACGAAFLSRESVRWHPLITLPQCIACFTRANSLLARVLVQQHHDHHQQQQQHQQGGGTTRKRAAPISGLVCLWCLSVLPEDAPDILRCGPRTPLPKHPLCPSRGNGNASRFVVCPSCLAAHVGPEHAAMWRAQHAVGAWACFICNKLQLVEVVLEKGWGLPSYPQDLRMSAEVLE